MFTTVLTPKSPSSLRVNTDCGNKCALLLSKFIWIWIVSPSLISSSLLSANISTLNVFVTLSACLEIKLTFPFVVIPETVVP